MLGRLAPLLLAASTVCACTPGPDAAPASPPTSPAPGLPVNGAPTAQLGADTNTKVNSSADQGAGSTTGRKATPQDVPQATPRAFPQAGSDAAAVPTPAGGEQLALDEATFWQIIQDTRTRAQADPEAMGQLLTEHLSTLDDAAVIAFEQHYLQAAARLYTWRHLQAAEMACGFVSEDVFTDWRAFVIAHGRATFEAVASDADALADVADLPAGCEGTGEVFGSAALSVYYDRHGQDQAALDVFPFEDLDEPAGPRLREHDAVRADLPRLAARIRHDGLGKGPGTYVDRRSNVLTRLLGTVTGTVLNHLNGSPDH
ncbi:hypothetical protein GCM10009528_35430 [Kineococcus aurantiacus]